MTTPTPAKRDRSKRGTWWTLKRRRWAYGIALALAAAAVSFGLVTGEQAAALVAVGGAVLGVTGLALANPTSD